MKRYETFLDKHCGQPFATIEEDVNGGLVLYEDVKAEIEKLKAENERLKAAHEWRGMESAPKDGTFVLVIDSEYGDHSGAFVARYTEAFSGSWLINTSHVPHVVYPTHWQPLPTPPQEQSHEAL